MEILQEQTKNKKRSEEKESQRKMFWNMFWEILWFGWYIDGHTVYIITHLYWINKMWMKMISDLNLSEVPGDADKSLARTGGKQAAAIKLGICSTYSPRSSIHFLARCSNFCKTLKKIQKFVRPTRSPWQQWALRRTKNENFSIIFLVQETGGSPTGPDPEKRVGDQDIGSPGRPVSSGLQVPVSRSIVVQEQDPLVTFRGFFLQNVLQLHQQRWGIFRVDSLALWKIINEEDAVLIPKNRRENFSNGFSHSEILGRNEPLCRHSIDCCFVSGS